MDELISVFSYTGEGYHVMMDFEAWRIGYMRFSSETEASNIVRFQRHENCDEAFVLLKGRCCLLVADGDEQVGNIRFVEMDPLRVYNIRKGTWHNHILDDKAEILVVENSDVSLENSPYMDLTRDQMKHVVEIETQLAMRSNAQ